MRWGEIPSSLNISIGCSKLSEAGNLNFSKKFCQTFGTIGKRALLRQSGNLYDRRNPNFDRFSQTKFDR